MKGKEILLCQLAHAGHPDPWAALPGECVESTRNGSEITVLSPGSCHHVILRQMEGQWRARLPLLRDLCRLQFVPERSFVTCGRPLHDLCQLGRSLLRTGQLRELFLGVRWGHLPL